jgi:AraC family transcriptional regulator
MATTPVWKQPNNPAWTFHGLTALYGGPRMSAIAEHSHIDAQVSVHFRPGSSQEPGQLPAHVHLYAPEQPHSGGWDQGWEVIVFHLSPLLLHEAAAELSRGGTFEIRPFHLGRDRVLEEMARMVLKEFRCPGRGGTFYVESIGHVVAGHVLRTHAEILPRSSKLDALSARELRTLRRFIADRIELGFTVMELAQCIALGPQRFARKLQLATGLSPWRYVQAERLSMARRMLKNQSIPLSDIASGLGFSDQSHFTNEFRVHHGVTPKAYRKGV